MVVGCGHMGGSHARAYHASPHFEIIGLVSRNEASRNALSHQLGGYPTFDDYEKALQATSPDAVCISTYPDTHADFACMAMTAGCHVFLEKPLALNLDDAQRVLNFSARTGKKLVVGYILQQHPSWILFVDEARKLGRPLVMRMNLNQQSCGSEWQTHKNIMESLSPIVDCGVHYVDVMCRMTQAAPVRVHAIQARLSGEIRPMAFNYGQLQIVFDDGSIGWYEAGWGPMMSTTAFFVKDVIGPNGAVSISEVSQKDVQSADVESHTKTGAVKVHHSALDAQGHFARPDDMLETTSEPDHDELCALEQEFFAKAIQGEVDLSEHQTSALNSLRIVLAADESARTGITVSL